jgi:hypothetical protein
MNTANEVRSNVIKGMEKTVEGGGHSGPQGDAHHRSGAQGAQ